jgi:hypothetical protein
VWHLEIPFAHVADAEAFRAFEEPGFVKVAWAIRLAPRGAEGTRVTFELRVDATDVDSWSKFRRYFHVIGPGSHFIRRSLLASLERRCGTPETAEERRALPGDELLTDAAEQVTQGITIAAAPAQIWPWLVQMGTDDFEVLAITPERALVLGGHYDADAKRQRPFDAPRPEHYWQITWSFVLEPLDATTTRLHVRARAAFPGNGRLHATWIRPAHRLMEAAQLRHLAARIEGRLPMDDARDVLEGVGGVAVMAAAFLTPFLREPRSRWGVEPEVAERAFPGDELVGAPRWSWTHGIEIDAPPDEVWPWVAQLGADRGGFYSYQWLENVAGCEIRNADVVHPDWAVTPGDTLSLHPKMPPLRVAAVEAGRWFVVSAPVDAAARADGKPWAEVSWLFFLEALPGDRTRLVSRYRCATSDDLATRLRFGAAVLEPIGFAMDRRMLFGVKARVESARGKRLLRSVARRRGTRRVVAKVR